MTEHKAIIKVTVEVHPVKNRECGFPTVPPSELNEFGIKPKMIVSISGNSKSECLNKLKKWLDTNNL